MAQASARTRRRTTARKFWPRFFQYLVLSLITVIIVVPLVVLLFASLKKTGEMFLSPYTIPNPPRWENYRTILSAPSYWVFMKNSLIVAAASTLGVLIVCSMAAFVFARMRFRGKNAIFTFLTLGLMFPITVAIMPVYLVIRQMQLTDTLIAVILVQTAFGISEQPPDPPRLLRGRSQRVAGRRGDRRLQHLRLFLARPDPFGPARAGRRRRADADCQLE